MKQPLLSIVVPTKNRYPYLKKLIELVESFNSNDIELVIQDNSDDNNEILEFLKDKYPFVVYNHIQGQIPMSTNSDKAILNSSGEYVCFIGDDDGVTKEIIPCVRMMKERDVEVLKPTSASYCWPDVRPGKYFSRSTRVIYDKPTGKLKKIDNEKVLNEIVSRGFVDRGNMPLLYHGIVRRDVLDKIFAIGGTCFPGSSPDISNAVAITLTSTRCYTYGKIITISGASMFHGGGVYLTKKKHPDLNDIKWLLPGAVDKWDVRLPKIGEGESIWCDSAIKALQYMKRHDIIERINFEYLYLHFALCHKDLYDIVIDFSKKKTLFKLKYLLLSQKRRFDGIIELLFNLIGRVPRKQTAVGFNDILEASDYYSTINCKI